MNINELKQSLKSFEDFEIWCHPDNVDYLKNQFDKYEPDYTKELIYYRLGIPVKTDKNLPKYVRRWKFPEHSFVEYEKSDESWAIPLGFGEWVDTEEIYLLKMDKRWQIYDNYLTPIDIFNNRRYIFTA
jgi:hypothetical protein